MPDETIEVADNDDFTTLLEAQVTVWQKRLRLQDWNVEVKLCRWNDMPQEAVAAIEYFEERKDARMHLLAPCDIPLVANRFLGDEASNYDISIVHELLHLHLIPLSDYENQTKRVAEEQVINALSRMIVGAYASTAKALVPPTTPTGVGHYI